MEDSRYFAILRLVVEKAFSTKLKGNPLPMAYTRTDYKTKKALKEDLKAGISVRVYQPNGDLFNHQFKDGQEITLEGPHFPKPHTWYARATVKLNEEGNWVIGKFIG